MNLWSINKHNTIKILLLTLQMEFGLESFLINEDLEKDSLSVTLIKPGQHELQAYIFVHGQADEHYGVHLEYPRFAEQNYNESMLIYEGLSLQLLINTLVAHFELVIKT